MAKYLTRITPNYNRWEKPSGSMGKCGLTKGSPYEGHTGLGWEEWFLRDFFNVSSRLEGFCYGFIQAFHKKNVNIGTIEELHLYTRICNGKSSKPFYLGFISDLEVLNRPYTNQKLIDKMVSFCQHVPTELNQLDVKDYQKDLIEMCSDQTLFNVRFKPENLHIKDFNFIDREIGLPHGWYRFNLYDLNKYHHFYSRLKSF